MSNLGSNNPRAVAEGTISKDGRRVKRGGKWVWRRKNKNFTSRDLKIGQTFKRTDNFGKQHSEYYTVRDISDGIVTFDYHSEVGYGSGQNKLTKQEFVNQIAGQFEVQKPQEEKINPKHVPEDQRIYVEQAINDGSIRKELDFENLPESIQEKLLSILPNKKTPFQVLEPSPGNIELFKKLGLDKRFKEGEWKAIEDGSDVEVFWPDEGFVSIDKLTDANVIHKLPLPVLKKLLKKENRFELRNTVDPKIWTAPPLPAYDSGDGTKQAWLGDYVTYYSKGASNPQVANNIKISYRIVKFLKNKNGEDTWILKDEKGNTRAIVASKLSDQITVDLSKKNSLLYPKESEG